MDDVGTPYASVVERLARDPASPLVADVDLATGERVELSVASAANGAAKAAHLVRDLAAGLGAPPRIALRLPLHWQAVTFALGAWASGAVLLTGEVDADDGVDAVVLGPDEAADPPAELSDRADVVWASRLHPFGLPFTPPPTFPVEDLTLALRQQPDSPPPDRGQPGEVAVVADGLASTLADLLARADEVGAELGATDRVLTCLPWSTADAWVAGVVLPALAGHSVVLVRGLSSVEDGSALERLCASERVAATAGVDVDGLPRIC
jgi:uncharacterized protein (TIGR03089 family)